MDSISNVHRPKAKNWGFIMINNSWGVWSGLVSFDYSSKSSNRICLLTSSFSWRMYVCFQRLPFIWIIYSCQQCLSPTISNIDGKSNKLSSNACVQNRNPSIISSIEDCNSNRMCLYLSSAFQSRQWQATKSDKTTSLMLFDLDTSLPVCQLDDWWY